MSEASPLEGRRRHHWPPDKCYCCGEPAVAGCDGVEYYNGTLIDSVPRISLEDPEAVVWCDRLMCEDHATTMGMTTKTGQVDTIDFCEKHRFKAVHGVSPEIKCK